MAKKKRKEQSRFIDVCFALLFMLIADYMLITAFQTFETKGDYVNVLLQYDDKIEWVKTANPISQIALLIVSLLSFFLMVSMTSKKNSGYTDAAGHGAYGDAMFSSLDDVRENSFIAEAKKSKLSESNALKTMEIEEGLILGRENNQLLVIHPDSSLDNRNVLIVGSSGSGKGQAFVINNLINNKSESIVVTDPKGELYDLTADIKRDQGYKVLNIDFLNLKGNRYNPLDYVENDIEAVKIATNIALNSAKDGKQDFFFNTARDLLVGLIIFVKDKYEHPNISKDVKSLFNEISDDENFLSELCEEIGAEHPSYSYFKDAAAASGNTRSSILASFAQQTGVFSLGSVAKLTETSDFTFHDLQNQKTVLYVKIPIKDNPVPALTATFFDQLITTLYKIGDENHSKLKIPTILLLDEFANLGKINDFDNTLSTCRGYNLSIITVVQDFAQLEGKYSKEIARMIINNHDTTLFLRTKDAETAKYFERLAGDSTIKFSTKSSSGSGGFAYLMGMSNNAPSKSTNEQYIKKPLISESLLLRMPTDKCFVFMPGHVLELEKAYQSKIFKNFITAAKPVKQGQNKIFPYTYPENREAYIKKFKFTPYPSDKSLVFEKTEEILTTPTQSLEVEVIEEVKGKESIDNTDNQEPTQIPPIDESTQAINQLVASYMEELQTIKAKPEGREQKSQDIVDEKQNISSDAQDIDEFKSDPTELEALKISAQLSKVEDRFKEMEKTREVINSLTIETSSNENSNVDEPSETEDIFDELPI